MDPLFGFAYSTAYQSPLVLSGVRLLICALLLIVPATLMGATLPVLVRYYTERIANAGTQAGRVYSANTLGAAVGTVAADSALPPGVGAGAGMVAVLPAVSPGRP